MAALVETVGAAAVVVEDPVVAAALEVLVAAVAAFVDPSAVVAGPFAAVVAFAVAVPFAVVVAFVAAVVEVAAVEDQLLEPVAAFEVLASEVTEVAWEAVAAAEKDLASSQE